MVLPVNREFEGERGREVLKTAGEFRGGMGRKSRFTGVSSEKSEGGVINESVVRHKWCY